MFVEKFWLYRGLNQVVFRRRFFRFPFSKDQHVDYNIQWSVLRKAKDYQNTTKRFNLYLAEELEIILAKKERSLNRKSRNLSQSAGMRKSFICPALSLQCLRSFTPSRRT